MRKEMMIVLAALCVMGIMAATPPRQQPDCDVIRDVYLHSRLRAFGMQSTDADVRIASRVQSQYYASCPSEARFVVADLLVPPPAP